MSYRHILGSLMSTVLLFVSTELAAQTLRWEQQVDLGYGDTATALTVHRSRVFAGAYGFGNGYNVWALRAFDGRTGTPLWQEQIPVPIVFPQPSQALPVALEASGVRLVAVGSLNGWTVRMYEATTGAIQWEDHVDWHGTLSDCNMAQTVVLNHQRVYVGGCVGGPPRIKAYALDGEVQWEVFAPNGPPDTVQSLHLRGEVLLVVKRSGIVMALRASTGQVLWQTPPLPNTSIREAAFGSNKIALIGTQAGQFWFLQVLKARNGQPVCSSVGEGIAMHVALHKAVYVGGGANPHDLLTRTVVRSYDLDTCAVNWEVFAPEMTDGHEGENLINALALDPQQGLLYVGSAMLDMRQRMGGWPDLLVRAHSIVDGAVVWEIRKDGEAHLWDGALELAAGSGQLYIAGEVNKHLFRSDNANLLVEAWNTREDQQAAQR